MYYFYQTTTKKLKKFLTAKMKNWIFGEKSAKHYLALQENFSYEQARTIIVKNKSIYILPYFVENDVALNLTFESLRVIMLLTNQGWIVAFVAYKNGAIIGSTVFNGAGSNYINWFDRSRLTSNTVWNDLASTSGNYFRYYNINKLFEWKIYTLLILFSIDILFV